MQTINVFGIPHLLDSICQHLTLNEIRQCRKVCKDWRVLYRWHDGLTLSYSSSAWSRSSNLTASQDLVLKSAHRLRTLAIISNSDVDFLLGSRCCRLKKLSTVVHNSYFHSDGAPTLRRVVESFWSLVHQNREGLLSLDITLPRFWRTPLTGDGMLKGLQSLSLLRNLQRLRFRSLSNSGFTASFPVRDIFLHLPSTLQDLEIAGAVVHCNGTDPNIVLDSQIPRSYRQHQIRRLHLSFCSFEGTGIGILIPFLKSCPDLEQIYLPTLNDASAQDVAATLLESCSKLHSFTFGIRQWGPENVWSPMIVLELLQSYPCYAIRQIRLASQTAPEALQIMEGLFSPFSLFNLEELCVGKAGQLYIRHFLRIVESCPRLKILRLLTFHEVDREQRRFSLSELNSGRNEWACTQLEVLNISIEDNLFLGRSCSWIGKKARMVENKYWRSKLLAVAALHGRLSRLPKLKNLRLNWNRISEVTSTEGFAEKVVEWKLESIWSSWTPIRTARTPWFLDLQPITREMVEETMAGYTWLTEPQLQYMGLHWPSIREVQLRNLGVRHRELKSRPSVRVFYTDEQQNPDVNASNETAILRVSGRRQPREVARLIVRDWYLDQDNPRYGDDWTHTAPINVLRDNEEYDYDFVHGFWKDEHESHYPQWISSWKKYRRFGAIHHRKSFRTRRGI